MRRRALLSSLAATALPLAAGCSGDSDEATRTAATEESTPTASPEDSEPAAESNDASTADHATVAVEEVAVQQGYVVREVADAIGVVGDDNRYLWVEVAVDGTALAPDAFALDTAYQEYEPVDSPRAYRFEGNDSPYTLQSGRGWLLFELPMEVETPNQRDLPTMAITNPVASIELDRSVADRIAYGPPELSVSMHGQYQGTPSKPIVMEVTNEGGVDHDRALSGRFVGALNRQGPDVAVTPVQRVAVDVPPGESRTVEIEADWHEQLPENTEEDDRTVEYKLNWAGDSTSVTIDDL